MNNNEEKNKERQQQEKIARNVKIALEIINSSKEKKAKEEHDSGER